jgi:hypothetical protein
MIRIVRTAIHFVPVLLFFLAGCAATGSWRPATGAPDHFLVGRMDGGPPVEPRADGRCHNPMVDPADGTLLAMVRAEGGYGDYVVPEGRYGVGAGEVLRIECATGRPSGIVKRRDD